VPDGQTAGVAETVLPTRAGDETTGAVVAAAADAGVAEVSEPPTASSMAAPIETIFLSVFELVISSMKSKPDSRPV
jgi:hypothetical protein